MFENGPPPIDPVAGARWQQILRNDRRVAVAVGVPLVVGCVVAALLKAPKWFFVFPFVLILLMQGLKARLFRCPRCGASLTRHNVINAGEPLICGTCKIRVA